MSDPSAIPPAHKGLFVLRALTTGFGGVVAMWAGWFVLNLPGLGVPTPAVALVAGLLLIGAVAVLARDAGDRAGWKLGLGAGLVAGLVNLLALGSMLTDTGPQTAHPSVALDPSMRPNAAIVVAGFLFACGLAGAIGGAISRLIARPADIGAQGWLSRFGWVASVATLELISVGGLVTSTESGLAVPDWPTSYGANMFLYPIGLMSDDRIFLEHSHRLFGTMVGITVIALSLCIAWKARDRRSRLLAIPGLALALALGALILVGHAEGYESTAITLSIIATLAALIWTIVAFAIGSTTGVAFALLSLVVAQGTLGGLRVTEQAAWLGVFHGVVAQGFLALLVAQAVWLSPPWLDVARSDHKDFRRWKFVATAALHATIMQIALGAMYRHLGTFHALTSHIAFSVIVIVFSVLTAAGATTFDDPPPQLRLRGSILGKSLLGVVGLQVALGIGALLMVMGEPHSGSPTVEDLLEGAEPVPLSEVLLTSAHHANGAILLGLLTMSYVWAKRAYTRPREPAK